MKRMIEILDPKVQVKRREHPVNPFPTGLAGKKVGYLDNGKNNADLLLQRVEEQLVGSFGFAEVVRERKAYHRGVSEGALGTLSECALVVTALGD